jgi:hypothetical protein
MALGLLAELWLTVALGKKRKTVKRTYTVRKDPSWRCFVLARLIP